MSDSILNSVKGMLQLPEDYTAFDDQVIVHINSVFATLYQLGVGPSDGFSISSDTETWVDYLDDDKKLNNVKTYVYLRVRMLFDPPTLGYLVSAYENQIKEQEWRLSITAASPSLTEITVIDGGNP